MAEINDLSTTDASNTVTGWTEGQAPSTVNNSGRASLGVIARYVQHTSGENFVAGTGTGVNSLSVSIVRSSLTNTASGSGSTGYIDGLTLLVKVPSTLTGAAYLNINGKKSHAIKDAHGASLSSSGIIAGQQALLSFRAAGGGGSHWQMLNAPGKINGKYIAMGSDAAGDVLYHNGTDYVRLGIGTAGQALVTNSAADAPEWGTSGMVVQSLAVAHEANVTGSSEVPNDDTIPTTSEMDAVSGFTQAITPTIGTNKIRATVHFNIAGTGGTGNRYVGIFKDAETDASAVAVQRLTDSSQVEHGTCVYEFVPGATTEITFKVYMGMLAGVTNWETNGTGGPLMGGVWKNYMIVEEITV